MTDFVLLRNGFFPKIHEKRGRKDFCLSMSGSKNYQKLMSSPLPTVCILNDCFSERNGVNQLGSLDCVFIMYSSDLVSK